MISARLLTLGFTRGHIRFLSLNVSKVALHESNSCGVITLSRPKALNSLDISMTRLIYPKLVEWNQNASISHIIIEGAGGKAFCAGGDVRAVVEAAKARNPLTEHFFREEYKLNYLIGILNKPFVALLDGITMGGGAGLSVHGRFRVATEKTLFAMPETAIGFFPDVGGGYFLPRLPHPGLGNFLALTGHRFKGIEVVWCGVATHFVQSKNISALKESLTNLVFETTSTVTEKQAAVNAVADILAKANEAPSHLSAPESIGPFLSAIADSFALFDDKKPVMLGDILSKLENYAQSSDQTLANWATKCRQHILTMSPTALKITLRQLQEGSKLSFADNFTMEYRLSQRFVHSHDFAEGVRALLIDKDNQPKWNPKDLNSIDSGAIQKFFEPLEQDKEWTI